MFVQWLRQYHFQINNFRYRGGYCDVYLTGA